MRVRVLAAVCAASIGLAACGDDSESTEETQGPAEVTEQFLDALIAGDGEAACGLVSTTGLEDLEEQTGESCTDTIETQAAALPEDAAENADSASFEVLEETDDTATVEASRPGDDPETFELVLEDGEWKVEG